MVEGAEQVARQAYAGFAGGDTAAAVSLVAEDLEWTFLDPSAPDPRAGGVPWPRPACVLDGTRKRVEAAGQARAGRRQWRARPRRHPIAWSRRHPGTPDGRLELPVLTVHDGKIVALRACRKRDEALGLVAAAPPGPESILLPVGRTN